MGYISLHKLPIGIQRFENSYREGYLYVDKTAFVYHLVTMGKPYFLSRPCWFGKSLLLLSTLGTCLRNIMCKFYY
ncbi:MULTISPECIES: AAA family ATPase [Bacteroides]|uniref:AAA family ATPase n=1 Tax=Bacteroides TaxID=816 RepID=UPI00294A6582|nr:MULTISPECIES: AAA family ATPase [Bacteroides]MDV6203422.1 AAA family ATPase [Bacteroides hominis (ex Liu et al. 2022)]